jgi:hypothetical protein
MNDTSIEETKVVSPSHLLTSCLGYQSARNKKEVVRHQTGEWEVPGTLHVFLASHALALGHPHGFILISLLPLV